MEEIISRFGFTMPSLTVLIVIFIIAKLLKLARKVIMIILLVAVIILAILYFGLEDKIKELTAQALQFVA